MNVDAAVAGGYDGEDLREIERETVQLAVLAIAGLAVGILAGATFFLNRVDPELFVVTAALLLLALGARSLSGRDRKPAAVWLTLGMAGVFIIGLYLLPADLVAPWISVSTLVVSALFGWRGAGLVALIESVFLLISTHWGWIPTSMPAAENAVLLCGSSVFVSWLISYPNRLALAWASSSYQRTLRLVQEARTRQAELARLSKSLSESYYVLEQLNLDLARARRAAEEARQLKARFAAAVSHELRTPLNLIIGFCEMMVLSPGTAYGQPLPAAYREDLEAVYRNACHISALVDDILDLSQIDADRMALHRQSVNLKVIVDEATATVAALFRNRGLRLEIALAEEIPAIYADRTRIRQILINLLTNAVRFTERGSVTIRAHCEGQAVVVAVADTGPGIAAEDLPYVFDEFRQVGSTSRHRGGNGFGLAVSRRFAELHGGSMWVESTLGHGSTFYLRLPLGDSVIAPATATGSWDDRIEMRVRGNAERNVVVVDESGEVSRIFQGYLDGYRVLGLADLVGDGQTHPPLHAVVVASVADEERWRAIARGVPAWRRLPVIFCPLRTVAATATEIGADAYLVKPVARQELQAVLHRLRPSSRTTRVLVVEDDPEMRRLVARMVRSFSRRYRVTTVADGRAALDVLRMRQFDVVLLDLLMPNLDGYGVLQAMRADTRLSTVPVAVITARGPHREAVLATQVRISRADDLTIGEVMRWLKGGLDALLAPGTNAPAPPAKIAA